MHCPAHTMTHCYLPCALAIGLSTASPVLQVDQRRAYSLSGDVKREVGALWARFRAEFERAVDKASGGCNSDAHHSHTRPCFMLALQVIGSQCVAAWAKDNAQAKHALVIKATASIAVRVAAHSHLQLSNPDCVHNHCTPGGAPPESPLFLLSAAPMAAAWYLAAYDPAHSGSGLRARGGGSSRLLMRLFSFPWVVAHYVLLARAQRSVSV